MPVTTNFAIPYPDGPSGLVPLAAWFAGLAVGVDNALMTGIGGAPKLAFSDAERNTLIPSPVQGNTVNRPDKGYIEQYFNTFNATTNPSGASPAGWYPTAGTAQFAGTAAGSMPNTTFTAIGATSAPYSELTDVLNWHNSSTNPTRITPTIPGLYRVNATSNHGGNTTGIRTIQVYKNGSPLAWGGANTTTPTSTNGGGPNTASTIMPMNGTTDYIEVSSYQSSGAALNATFSTLVEFISVVR